MTVQANNTSSDSDIRDKDNHNVSGKDATERTFPERSEEEKFEPEEESAIVTSSSLFPVDNPVGASVMQQILDDKQTNDSPLYHRSMQNPCAGYVLRRFPRVSSLCVAVLLPCASLILLSLFLGTWLARLEAAHEIESNDAILAIQSAAELSKYIIPNLTVLMPRLCAHYYIQSDQQQLPTQDQLLQSFFRPARFEQESQALLLETFGPPKAATTMQVNPYDWFQYTVECGEEIRSRSSAFLDQAISDAIESSAGLTFNWIRCFDGASRRDGPPPALQTARHIPPLSEMTPDAQTQYYQQQWKQSRTARRKELYQQNLAAGVAPVAAQEQAFQEASVYATGGDNCELNAAGSAWFWFTIMTTVGFGNQAPVSVGGRILVFTFGFLSIMIFASVLASSGVIVAFVFDDTVTQYQLQVLKRPSWGCLFWATLCYGWLAVIAAVTKTWKDARLYEDGTEFSFFEGYWFSYITTTTVGLGDYFLEPSLILNRDLWYFPLLILTGFTLLSAFLTKFQELVENFLDTADRRGFVESLLKDVEHMGDLARLFPHQDPHGLLRQIEDNVRMIQRQQAQPQQQDTPQQPEQPLPEEQSGRKMEDLAGDANDTTAVA